MKNVCSLATGLVLLLGACGGDSAEDAGEAVTTEAEARTSVVMALPITSSVAAATEHFMLGQRDMDMARTSSARGHFAAAVQNDGAMAMGYLRAAQTANSFEDYRTFLEQAEAMAPDASEAEQLLIGIERLGNTSDREGQLAAAERLVEVAPESPRAWMLLASIQTGFNRVEDARTSMQRAIGASPDFANAHIQLANSLILRAPKDLAAAEEHANHAVQLEPGEALPQDILGDVHRAGGDLEAAAEAYGRAGELEPTSGSALQQLGHVNSFLGDYEAARLNYDEAIARAEGNTRANWGIWRAFVNLHEGNGQAAVDELNQLADRIDAMDIPEPLGVKIGVLGNVAFIAVHNDLLAQAENAITRRTELMRIRIEEVGTDEFRRGQEADILFFEGLLAAKGGDQETAMVKAQEMMAVLEPDNDPRKNEGGHDLMGISSQLQGDHAGALAHLEQGDLNWVYNQYYRALANEALGNAAEAQALFNGIEENRFNNLFTSLVRGEAILKAG